MMKTFLISLTAAIFAAGAAFAADRPYELHVVATDDYGVLHYVENMDTGAAAAIWTDGEDRDSARLIEGADARAEFEQALGETGIEGTDPGDLKLKLFGISIYADDDGDEDTARVVINRRGDRDIVIDAHDNGPNGDAAHVQIHGADDDGAEDFIDDIDEAPRSLKREMKAYLGL